LKIGVVLSAVDVKLASSELLFLAVLLTDAAHTFAPPPEDAPPSVSTSDSNPTHLNNPTPTAAPPPPPASTEPPALGTVSTPSVLDGMDLADDVDWQNYELPSASTHEHVKGTGPSHLIPCHRFRSDPI
jgi:hypothetical protein